MNKQKSISLKLFSLLVFFSLSSNLSAQFQKHFPIDFTILGTESLDLDEQENYFISGYGLNQYSYNPYIIKTKSNGDPVWFKYYELFGNIEDGGFSDTKAIQSTDHIASVGYHRIPSSNKIRMIVSLIDANNGNPAKNISIYPPATEGIGRANAVISHEDQIAVMGRIAISNENNRVAMSTFDNSLNKINSALYFFKDNTGETPYDMVATDDGYLIVGGSIPAGSQVLAYNYSHQLFIMKVDWKLNYQWNKTIQIKEQYIRGSGITINEKKDEVYISGDLRDPMNFTNTVPFVLKMQSNGTINWMKYYKGDNISNSKFNSIVYNELTEEVHIAADFKYGGIFPSGFVTINPQGDVQKSEYFYFVQYIAPSLYTIFRPRYARDIIRNNVDGFSSIFTNSYSGQSPVSQFADHGAVLVEALKDGSTQTNCNNQIELAGNEIGFSESSLTYLDVVPLLTEKFVLVGHVDKTFSMTCEEEYIVNNSQGESKGVIYPNPARDRIHLNSESIITKASIQSITGLEVIDVTVRENEIDISKLPRGIYVLHLTNRDGSVTKHTFRKE